MLFLCYKYTIITINKTDKFYMSITLLQVKTQTPLSPPFPPSL